MQDQKVQLRRQFRQCREQLEPAIRAGYDLAILAKLRSIPEIARARTVFSYISSGTEVATHVLLDWLQAEGKQVLVPKITGNGQMIAVAFSGWGHLHPGEFGIPAPVASVEYNGQIDVCIVPGLAFSATGARLGQGLGYYDRWLATHPVGCKLGLGYESQLADELPANKHDVLINVIVTEQQIIRVS